MSNPPPIQSPSITTHSTPASSRRPSTDILSISTTNANVNVQSSSSGRSPRSLTPTTTLTSPISQGQQHPSAPGGVQLPIHQKQKRNRAALRDYYGIKTTHAGNNNKDGGGGGTISPASSLASSSVMIEKGGSSSVGKYPPSGDGRDDDDGEENEKGGGMRRGEGEEDGDVLFDREDFDPEGYVNELLRTQGLVEVLKVEGRILNEIRALDGERKALVYDNYSKLIAATETIRKMRGNMDPLALRSRNTPSSLSLSSTSMTTSTTSTTSTLMPAMAHIAELVKSIAIEQGNRHRNHQACLRQTTGAGDTSTPTSTIPTDPKQRGRRRGLTGDINISISTDFDLDLLNPTSSKHINPNTTPHEDQNTPDDKENAKKELSSQEQILLVTHIMSTPSRIRHHMAQGRIFRARREWETTRAVLNAWDEEKKGDGVVVDDDDLDGIRRECEASLLLRGE